MKALSSYVGLERSLFIRLNDVNWSHIRDWIKLSGFVYFYSLFSFEVFLFGLFNISLPGFYWLNNRFLIKGKKQNKNKLRFNI